MGGSNTKRRRKAQRKRARELERKEEVKRSAEEIASGADGKSEPVKGPKVPPKQAPSKSASAWAAQTSPPLQPSPRLSSAALFLDAMNARLKRFQKPLGLLLLGNFAAGESRPLKERTITFYLFLAASAISFLAAYLFATRKNQPPKYQGTDVNTPAESAAVAAHQSQEPIHTREAHEGPSGTSLVGSGGSTLSTPGGTPIPMPSFAASDHHRRHVEHGQGSPPPHRETEGHGGPSGTSLIGSGGATLSTPGGTPIPLYSKSPADHHKDWGDGRGTSSSQARRREEGWVRSIELDQNGDPVVHPPDGERDVSGVSRPLGGLLTHGDREATRVLEAPNFDLALEQYRHGLLQELEKRRNLVPRSGEEKALIDQEKEVIKEHLRHMPKDS